MGRYLLRDALGWRRYAISSTTATVNPSLYRTRTTSAVERRPKILSDLPEGFRLWETTAEDLFSKAIVSQVLKLRSNCLILYADKSSETPLVEEDMQYLQRPATVNSSLYRTRTAAAAECRLHGGCYNRRLSVLMGDVTKIYFQAQSHSKHEYLHSK